MVAPVSMRAESVASNLTKLTSISPSRILQSERAGSTFFSQQKL